MLLVLYFTTLIVLISNDFYKYLKHLLAPFIVLDKLSDFFIVSRMSNQKKLRLFLEYTYIWMKSIGGM